MKNSKKLLLLTVLALTVTVNSSSCAFIRFNKAETETAAQTETSKPETSAETVKKKYTFIEPQSTLAERSSMRLSELPDTDMSAQGIIIAATVPEKAVPLSAADEEPVIQARADRISAVKKKFKTGILINKVTPAQLATDVRNAHNSGLYYADLICIPYTELGRLSLGDCLADMKMLPFAEYDKEYYSKNLTATATVQGKTFAAAGSATFCPEDYSGIFYNRKLLDTLGIEDPNKLVERGEWTMDNFTGLLSDVKSKQKDGTPFMSAKEDDELTDKLTLSQGIEFVTNNNKAAPKVDYFDSKEKNIDSVKAANKISKLLTGGSYAFDEDAKQLFLDGKLAFCAADVSLITQIDADKLDWGLLPFPKYGKEQKNYVSIASDDSQVFCVINGASSYEYSGLLLEAFSRSEYELCENAFFSVCVNEKLRDGTSLNTLYSICKNAKYDFAHAFAQGCNGLADSTYIAFRDAVSGKGEIPAYFSDAAPEANENLANIK